MNALTRSWPRVLYQQTTLGGGVTQLGASYPGGLDLTTPSLRLQPGALRDCLNFECAQSGGYARVKGYERLDGRAKPSAATYTIIQLTPLGFNAGPGIGDVITQLVSTATGKIIALVYSPVPYIVVTQVTGTFDATHDIMNGLFLVGTATTLTVSLDAQTKAIYKAAAADVYRALVGAVPGSGPVRGVVGMDFAGVDHVYAFRNNAGATASALYKATGSGWTLVPFLDIVSFTAGGTAVPLDGDTLTQGGVTATIKRVMWQSGAWTGTAAGQFVITAPAGGSFVAGAATTTSTATVTLSGAETAITMAPGGRFEFVKCNFSGQAITRRIYGCDGVNKAFEFDGTTLAPITTRLSPDTPSHLAFHKNYLVLSQAASIFGCAPNAPFKWQAADGAWEIATGDTVNGMITLPGDPTTAALAVLLRSNTAILYGTDPTTFNYVTFNQGVGALPYSVQNLFDTFVFDDLGVVTLRTTLNYGNFLPSSLTRNILPFIAQERGKITASTVNRPKSQYRVFFSDGYGLYLTVANQQYLGASVVAFPNPVFCCDTADLVNSDMVTYFGSSDSLGYVYEMERGTSFDGGVLNAFATMAWDPIKSPRVLKRFRAGSIEVQGDGYASIMFSYRLGYGTPLIGQQASIDMPLSLEQLSHWDTMTWDEFVWDGNNLSPSDVSMTGTGENVQVTVSSGTNYMDSYTLNSLIYHYTPRRGIRV